VTIGPFLFEMWKKLGSYGKRAVLGEDEGDRRGSGREIDRGVRVSLGCRRCRAFHRCKTGTFGYDKKAAGWRGREQSLQGRPGAAGAEKTPGVAFTAQVSPCRAINNGAKGGRK